MSHVITSTRRLGVLAVAALCPSVVQAESFTVGDGEDFAEIQEAVDAAAPGDVILVTPGIYTSFSVDKTLTIVGAGPALTTVLNLHPGQVDHTVLVRDIDADETLVISGMQLLPAFPATLFLAVVDVADCEGTVVLHNLSIDGNTANCAVRASAAQRLLMNAVTASGNGNALYPYPVYLEETQAWISGSQVIEQDQPVFLDTILAGAGADRSTVWIFDSSFFGANIDPPFFSAGGNGFEARDSTLRLVRSSFQGGQGFGDAPGGHGASLFGESALRAHPDSTVLGGLDGAGLETQDPVELAGRSVVQLPSSTAPSLRVETPFVLGGSTIQIETWATPQAQGTLLLSLGLAPALSLESVMGALFVAPDNAIPVTNLTFDADGSASYSLPVPVVPELQGTVAVFQLLAPESTRLALSNPGLVMLL